MLFRSVTQIPINTKYLKLFLLLKPLLWHINIQREVLICSGNGICCARWLTARAGARAGPGYDVKLPADHPLPGLAIVTGRSVISFLNKRLV